MSIAVAPEDMEQLWIEFKKDLSNQELRNRLVEIFSRWSNTTASGSGRGSPKASSWTT